MRILLIEPDRMLARTYLEALGADGHIVDVCATAQSAISCANEIRPDVVILELQLVSHGGIEFLYEFRSYSDWQAVPVVVLTHVPAGEFAGCRQLLRDELGVKTYLYKPRTSLRKLLHSLDELAPVSVQ